MSDFIENLESKPFTEGDLRKIVGQDPVIAPYSYLRGLISIENLFPRSEGCIILVKQKPTFGHWVSLVFDKESKRLSYFDSYGKPVDYWLGQLTFAANKRLGQTGLFLTHLINWGIEDGVINKFEWNKQELQSSSEDVANCGRYAALRILMPNLDNKAFVKLISDDKGYGSVTDKNVSLLTALQVH